MYFVTASAALESDRLMLERERTAFVPVTIEATGLIGRERLRHRRPEASVRIVAIDAGHRPFREPVMIGPLELRPDIEMAARALLVNGGRLAGHQTIGRVAMNFMAGRAGNRVLGMAALQSSDVRRLIQVAGKA